MARERIETHAAPTPEVGNLRLVLDQHIVEGSVYRRIDLTYTVAGKSYRALLDGPEVPRDVHAKAKALLKAILVTDTAALRQMGFEAVADEALAPEPE